ncbi:MAG: methyltransferase domain-containing protein [Gammaproteobacteria bacterium]|nr:methyltransferase domain-containing protein [Gammaproteobacteria bacterium]
MNIVAANNLACPIDKLELVQKQGCYQCVNGHCFDIAKQGYVNLLPVQHKKSKDPGDSKAMVQARSRFLDNDFYKPIADKLSKIIFKNLSDDKNFCVLDAGCGEGYYLNQLINAVQALNDERDLAFIGMDISKPAIIAASRRNKWASWVVGSNSQPPFLKQSVDVIFCVFGFHSFQGFKNILKSGGKVILVEPGKKHLQELREIIYSEPAGGKSAGKTNHDSDYTLMATHTLEFKINLESNQQIMDLLTMTPHLFRANRQGKSSIESMDSLGLMADIIFSVFEYNPAV